MRIALLAMMEPAGAGQRFPRAWLRVAGATLAQHQLGLALALDCQRVVCLARDTSPEMIALQHAAEDSGLQFAIVTAPRQLAGLVTATDDLLVIGEGLFVDPASAAPLFDDRKPVVLTQPVEGALAAGFERIDLNRAGAGLMRIPGELAEKLHELPGDCDINSALMRIALQSGVAMREVPAASRSGCNWRLVRNEAEAFEVEGEWLRACFEDGATSPGLALARAGAIGFGSSLLHAGNASNGLSAGVVGTLAVAGVLGWFGLVPWAFALASLAWLLNGASRLLRKAERQTLGRLPPAIPRADVLGWLVDLVLAGLVLADTPAAARVSPVSWLAMPTILMLLLALLARVVRTPAAIWIGDRFLLGLVLAAASAFGQVPVAVQLGSIVLIVTGLLLAPRPRD